MRRLAALALVLAAACGGSVRTASSDGGADAASWPDPGDTCRADYAKCRIPPPRPDVPPNAQTGTSIVIAVDHLFLGDTDRNGTPSATAWKDYGYNLDGLISTKSDTNHCKLVTGANPRNVQTDGNGGVDNSFGNELLSLITSLDPAYSEEVNQQIKDGHFTLLLRVDNLEDTSVHPDQSGVTAALFRGADKGSPAAFDGSDVWPIAWNYTTQGNAALPVDAVPDGYVAGGVWVSGFVDHMQLPLVILSQRLELVLSHVVVTAQIAGSGPGARAANGVIAGIIDPQQLIERLKAVGGYFDPTLCSGPTFDTIAQQIRQASDIMLDGTNGDPTQTCDGISIGLGFDGAPVELGAVAAPEPPPPDPCAPAP